MKKKLRFGLRLAQVWFRKYYYVFLFSLAIGWGSYLFWPKLASLVPTPRQTKLIGVVGIYDYSTLPVEITQNLSLGLTQINESGEAYPGLALRWSTDAQGKSWTFYLDPELKWQDGTPIRAQDISYQFSDVKQKIVDDLTLNFELPNPFAPFPIVVSTPVFKQGLVGVGSYKLVKAEMAFNYFREIRLLPISRGSRLPVLVYKFYPSEEMAITAFKLGKIDQLLSITQLRDLQNWPDLDIEPQVSYDKFVGLFFNTQHPDLKDKRLRQALSYAIHEKSWDYPRADSPVSEKSWAYNPNIKKYDYDLEKAKKLLAQEKSDQALALTLTTTPEWMSQAEEIVKDWQAVGINAKIQVVTSLPEQFDVLLISQQVPPDPDQYSLWHSTQTETNLSGYQNPKIDKLLEDGRREIDEDKRKQIYHDFQRFLMEDVPVLPLFHPIYYQVKRV